jgi:hypothetical protein
VDALVAYGIASPPVRSLMDKEMEEVETVTGE